MSEPDLQSPDSQAPVQSGSKPPRQPGESTDASGQSEQSLDELFDKAGELLRTIDETSREVTATDSTAAPPSAPEPRTLSELDQSLAANLDVLMEADYQSIETVLDGVFEEQAVLVQKLGEPPPPPPPEPAPVAAEAQPPHAPPMPASDVAAQASQPPAPVSASSVEPAMASTLTSAVAANEPAQAVAAPTKPEASEATANSAAPPKAAVLKLAESPSPEPARVVEKPQEPVPVPERRQEAQASQASSIKSRMASLVDRAARPAIGVLILMNYPLRFVPPKLRPAIDWIALSLLAWVPIVWIMVLMLGSSHSTDSASHIMGEHAASSMHDQAAEPEASGKKAGAESHKPPETSSHH